MGAKRRSRVVRYLNDNGGRLQISVDGRNKDAVMRVVPQGRRYMRGYVWIGDDERCFGYLPTTRLLALADAIRTEVAP